jgi:sugar lactone lactonase YvrE
MSAITRRRLLCPLTALLTIATAFLASGCLWGIVRDADTGDGIGGVTVSYTDADGNTHSTTTNAGGLYAFDIASGPIPVVGSATFDLSAPGYDSLTATRSIQYNDNPNATLANPSSFWEVQHFDLVPQTAVGIIDTVTAGLSFPVGVVYDKDGDLYFSDRDLCVVRKVDAGTGAISTVAGTGVCGFSGDGGSPTSAQLNAPTGLALDRHGNLFITDSVNCRIRKVDFGTNTIMTVAGNGTCGFSGDGGPATAAQLMLSDVASISTQFVWSDIALDAGGNLYIADIFNCRVRRVDARGNIATIAGSGATGFACGAFSGDGGPSTAARLYHPVAVALENGGDVYVAELGNCRIREIDAGTGNIHTIAGNGACTSSGDGGPALSAGLANPRGLAMDAAGDLYISEFRFVVGDPFTQLDCNVRRVDTSMGDISTVAGSDTCGFSGDGGDATNAEIRTPADIALSCDGSVAFAEPLNGRLRVVYDASSGGPSPDTDHDGLGYVCD